MAVQACDSKVGDSFGLPPRRSGFAEWNRYAAVNDEFVPIHMDDEAARRAGYPVAIGMGRLQWSYLHNMLREWLGGTGRIVSLGVQFRGPNLRDSVQILRGTVTAERSEGELRLLDCAVEVCDDAGTVLVRGTATVEVPA